MTNQDDAYRQWRDEHYTRCNTCGNAKPNDDQGAPVGYDQTQPLTDAELCAIWAQEALGTQRYELGEALARLALQAHRTRREDRTVKVRFAGETRQEQPARVRAAVPAGPTGDADADLEREARGIVELAATSVFQRPTVVPDARRCMGWTQKDGVAAPCQGGLYYEPERQTWLHVHPGLDAEHQAVAIVEAQQ